MLDTYTTNNHTDFNARYSNTYGWMLPDGVGGRKVFVYLKEVDGLYLYFTTGSSMVYNAKIDQGVMFNFIPVDRGWFTTQGGSVLFLQRVPERQWKRGISPNNTRITNIEGMFSEKLSYTLLEAIFSNEGTIMPYKKGSPFRISKHFAISSHQNVYFYNQHIGYLVDDTLEIGKQHLVEQELSDAINRNNLTFKVKMV
jgi:hypothetical protein